MDPEPKRTRTTSVTDTENLADRMDEDNFRRIPATSHPLEPVDDENVSKKERVARNVLQIRTEDRVKFDVNEEAWPNADLAIHSTYEGNEKSSRRKICSCAPGSRRQTFLPKNGSCSQVGLDE